MSRAYRYSLYTARVRNPLLMRYALYVPQTLDVEAMRRALAHTIGEHDFAAFGQPTVGESTTRRMLRTDVIVAGPQIAIEVEANGFLYRMVRRIVGTLIPIGRGERSDEEFAAILQAADPKSRRAGRSTERVVSDPCELLDVGAMSVKTYSLKESDITREWYVVDAAGQTLGRLSSTGGGHPARQAQADLYAVDG